MRPRIIASVGNASQNGWSLPERLQLLTNLRSVSSTHELYVVNPIGAIPFSRGESVFAGVLPLPYTLKLNGSINIHR